MTKPTGLQYHLQTGSGWTDISPFVKYVNAQVEINRGRQDQFSAVQAGTLTAVLDNSDGRFAPGEGYKLGVNYITNPRFQNDLTGWTPSANLTAVWDVSSVAAKLTATSTAALTYQFTVTLPSNAPGKTYTITGSINASGTAIGKTVTQKVEFYDGASTLISTVTRVGSVTLVSGWQTVSTFMTVPVGAVTAKVFPVFVPGGWAVNDFVLLDNAAFTDYAAGLYFDGAQITIQNGTTFGGLTSRDSLGFFQFERWNGIPDASTSTLMRATPYTYGVSSGVAVGNGMSSDNGIRTRFPDTNNHNMVANAEDSSFEAGTVGAWTNTPGWGTVANSAVRAFDGTKSLVITSSTTGGAASVAVLGLVCGLTYTAQVRVWVPAGQPDPQFDLSSVAIGTPATTSLKAQWVTLTNTFKLPLGTGSPTFPQVWWASGGTAGQQVWVDALHVWEGSTAPPAFITGPNPTFQDKFNGYLSLIPVQWPGGNNYSEVQITAGDRLAPLARRTFKSVVQEEILYDKPIAYYTLGDATGSTSGGDTSGNGQQAMQTLAKGTTGTVSFGTGTGPPTDGLTACVFTPVSTSNFKYLAAQYPTSISGFFDNKTIIATFAAATATGKQTIWRVFDQSHYWRTYDLGFDATSLGKLTLNWGSAGAALTSPLRYDDGQTHQVAIVFAPGAYPNMAITMYVDGVQVATSPAADASGLADVVYLQIGGDAKFNSPFNGTMSHVAVFQNALAAARILAQSTAQKTGFLNERSDQRVARYARWAGLATTDQVLETGKLTTTDHLDTSGQAAQTAIESVASSEGGLAFIDRSGRLAFHSRAHRWDAAPFITLAPDDVGRDTQFVLDNQLLVNQVTSSSKSVANLTIANTSSITAHGVYPVTLQLLSTSTADVTYISQWYATVNATPKPRTNTILIDLLTSPQAFSDLFKSMEIGATLAIFGLPTQAPTSEWLLCVEGWKEVISSTEWSVLINTSTAVPMWKLEDPVYGGIDSVNRIAY